MEKLRQDFLATGIVGGVFAFIVGLFVARYTPFAPVPSATIVFGLTMVTVSAGSLNKIDSLLKLFFGPIAAGAIVWAVETGSLQVAAAAGFSFIATLFFASRDGEHPKTKIDQRFVTPAGILIASLGVGFIVFQAV